MSWGVKSTSEGMLRLAHTVRNYFLLLCRNWFNLDVSFLICRRAFGQLCDPLSGYLVSMLARLLQGPLSGGIIRNKVSHHGAVLPLTIIERGALGN